MEALLGWLYPNRVLVAVLTIVVVGVLTIIGWRRGWHHAARRHPRATGIGLVAVLTVALPLGWYLGSPLVIRTALIEPAPTTQGATGSSPGPAASTGTPPSPHSPTPTDRSGGAPSTRVLEGDFVGADDFHFAMGKARLQETAPGRWSLRFEDFSVRNGPDLFVFLSPDPEGYVDGAIELSTLKATDGSFNYDVPPDVDIDEVRSVVIWCKAFSVQFGAASLAE